MSKVPFLPLELSHSSRSSNLPHGVGILKRVSPGLSCLEWQRRPFKMIDQLSQEVEALLVQEPIYLDPREVLAAEKNYGTTFVLKRLQETFDELFPGWRAYYKCGSPNKSLRGTFRSIRW